MSSKIILAVYITIAKARGITPLFDKISFACYNLRQIFPQGERKILRRRFGIAVLISDDAFRSFGGCDNGCVANV